LAGVREQVAAVDCTLMEHATVRLQPEDKKSWQRFQRELDVWMDSWKPPVAILSAYDPMARYIADAAQRRGLNVPSDVALVGSANESHICTMLEPSLSSIDLGFERIGYAAAEALDRWMKGRLPRGDVEYLPPRQLIIRQSSGAFAVVHPAVVAVLSYIGENLHKQLTLDGLAQRVATTPRTLSRLFQKSLGKTVHEMVTQLRIERVKRELVESDDLLKTIARRCGFRDAVYMCKVFQGLEQITPSEYRASR
jgi:LacI family transcriptional regulator